MIIIAAFRFLLCRPAFGLSFFPDVGIWTPLRALAFLILTDLTAAVANNYDP